MSLPVDYKHSIVLFDDILNIVYKHVAVSGDCIELVGQNQSKPGSAMSTELPLAPLELVVAV